VNKVSHCTHGGRGEEKSAQILHSMLPLQNMDSTWAITNIQMKLRVAQHAANFLNRTNSFSRPLLHVFS